MGKRSVRIAVVSALVAALVAIPCAVALQFCIRALEYVPTWQMPLIIAHRGDTTHAPENSTQSIAAAGRAHADYAEIDVRLTADGRPVVFHDRKTGRLATSGLNRKVNSLTYRQLAGMRMGKPWINHHGGFYHVPTLDQAIETAQRTNDHLGLLMEMKTDDLHAPKLAYTMSHAVEKLGFAKRTIIMSTSRQAVDVMHALHPDWHVGWCLSGNAKRVDWRQPMDFVVIRSHEVTRKFMFEAKVHNVPVYVGQADSHHAVNHALASGARGLLSNNVHHTIPAVRSYLVKVSLRDALLEKLGIRK